MNKLTDTALPAALEGIPLWIGMDVTAEPLSGGLTNENWLVASAQARWVAKVPGAGTDGYIDRRAANAAARSATRAGITAPVCFFDPGTGIEVSEFLEGHSTCTTAELRLPGTARQVMELYRLLHAAPAFEAAKTLFEMIDEHLEQLAEAGGRIPSSQRWLLAEFEEVRGRFLASGLDIVPSHNDPMPGNFMNGPAGLKMIDFEFAAGNDRSADLGLFLAEMFVDEPVEEILDVYFGSTTAQDLARVRASRALADIKWGLWGLLNASVRDVEFDYYKYGAWKLMRAGQFIRSLPWDATKAMI